MLVFISPVDEAIQNFLSNWLEGFLYGRPELCALTCTLAKDVQLFPGLGLYSGIFAMYLQYWQSTKSGTAIFFYAVCLLYVLSTASLLSDIATLILLVSNNSICKYTFLFFISCADANHDIIASASD